MEIGKMEIKREERKCISNYCDILNIFRLSHSL